MIIEKIKVENYKIFKNKIIELNESINIFVGENDSGKSSILELISIVTSGKFGNINFERQLKANLFNFDIRNEFIMQIKKLPEKAILPIIRIEAYCKNEEKYSDYKGTNNSLGEDCPGISVLVEMDNEYSKEYKNLVEKNEIYDIPIEFYKVQYRNFKGESVIFRYSPFKIALIDTTKKDYSNMVNRFVAENISTYLSEKEKIDLCVAYRKNKNNFRNNDVVSKLNEEIERNVKLADRSISIDMMESTTDEWKNEMSISVDNIPFENIGFGSQNTIKIELALKNSIDETNLLLVEEPENNLSYGNMSKLITKMQENKDKQIFISTHSSFVANKLGLSNIILVSNGKINNLSKLNDDTMNYFKKLPGYDTLRLVLANEVILVEGPADDLIVQRAYFDKYSRLPIEDGVDIIVVDSLAFKRYCDIALLINKKIKIVTDNDGNIYENIKIKYKDYFDKDSIDFFYEKDETLKTLEPSVISVNKKSIDQFKEFKNAISKNESLLNKNEEEILSFMKENKTEWSMRVFDYVNKIEYPEYIKDAIKK